MHRSAHRFPSPQGCQAQARPFYQRSGYGVFAQLDDWLNNAKRYFMRKRLQTQPLTP